MGILKDIVAAIWLLAEVVGSFAPALISFLFVWACLMAVTSSVLVWVAKVSSFSLWTTVFISAFCGMFIPSIMTSMLDGLIMWGLEDE